MHTELPNKVESKCSHLIGSPPLTDYLQPLTLRHNVVSLASIAICMLTALLNLLIAYLSPPLLYVSVSGASFNKPAMVHAILSRVKQAWYV